MTKEEFVLVEQVGDGSVGFYDVEVVRPGGSSAEVVVRYSALDKVANHPGMVAAHLLIHEKEDVINITFHPEEEGEKCVELDWSEIELMAMLYKVYNEKLNRYRSEQFFLKWEEDED